MEPLYLKQSLHHRSSRQEFWSALRRLAELRGRENEIVSFKEQSFFNLVEIEKVTANAREKCDAFVKAISDDCDVEWDYRVNTLMRSCVDELLEKATLERILTMRLLLGLQDIFCSEAREALDEQLGRLANVIESNDCPTALLGDENLKVDCAFRCGNRSGEASIQPECRDESFSAEPRRRDHNILNSDDIRCAVKAFCDTVDKSFLGGSSMSITLLYGPTGCGKTFLCNEIEKVASSKTVNGKQCNKEKFLSHTLTTCSK
jgi:chromosomal replication initiation ATPase DnaA